jgi:hypothetical protein
MKRASLVCWSAVVFVVSCKKPSVQTATDESARAAQSALARSGPAPESALFLAESGVVSFAWSLDSAMTGAQKGEAVLKFDRWGNRQATSGYPGPSPDKVLLSEGGHLTSYNKAQHSVMSTAISVASPFKPEERRTLQQDFSGAATRIVAGTRCVERTVETPVANGSSGHVDCIGRGIVLETTEHASMPPVGDITMHMVAAKVAWNESIPESVFEIPSDIPVTTFPTR